MSRQSISSILLSAAALVTGIGCATAQRVAEKQPVPKVETAATEANPTQAVADPLAPGYELEAAERWPDAVAFYAAVLREQPANSTALHRLAVIATYREDDEAAANYYRRAMELDPRNAALLADAGYFLSLQKQYEPAALMLQQALQLDPENERAINNFATIQGLRGEIDTALVLFRRVNPPAVALQSLASIHEQRGEWQLALACHLEAQSVDPSVTVPENVLAQVEQLRHPTLVAEATETESATEEPAETETTVTPPAASVAQTVPRPSHPVRRSAVPVQHPLIQEAANVTESAHDEPVVWAEGTGDEADVETAFDPPGDVALEESLPTAEELVGPEWTENELTEAVETVPVEETAVSASRSARPRETALEGCCPVALRDASQLIDGRKEFCLNHAGVVYAFSSADAVQKFRLNPERYIPSAGGLDVISVRSGKMERGSLHYSTWFRNRLFLFTSADHVDEFRADPLRYVDLN